MQAFVARRAFEKSFIRGLALVLLLAAPLSAHAESRPVRGYDFTGPYAQLGASIGQINFDNSNLENDVAGGFTLGGGYRFLPWLAADANFSFLAGEVDVDGFGGDFDANAWGFTFGPKVYPLALVKVDAIPENVQPYGLIGIGGGEAEIDDTNVEEDYFLARFILGFDVWMTDQLGLFVEGGGFATSEDDVEGAGTFTLGGQVRF